MLKITNLFAGFESTIILQGINLNINKGEVHAIMGPNGSGKSTLSKVLVGHPDYEVSEGSIFYEKKDLLEMEAEERSLEGIFMSYQHPVEIAGVNNNEFLRMAYNSKKRYFKQNELDALDFNELVTAKMNMLGMDKRYQERCVNDGFSGGEKKKNEMLQMAILEPKLIILDELDSGLDIDALKVVSQGVNELYCKDRSAIIIITHFPRILQYIKPNYVHVMQAGKLVKSGDIGLAHDLEAYGYDQLLAKA